MSDTLTKDQKQQIVLGAYTVAGSKMDYDTDEDYHSAVRSSARELTMSLNEESDLFRAIEEIDEATRFTGTLVCAEVERTSKRGFIGLATKGGTKYNQEGVDTMRTDRHDSSAEAVALTEYAQNELIGHRVLVYMKHEETAGGNKVRVLIALKDLGVDKMADRDELVEKKEIALSRMKG